MGIEEHKGSLNEAGMDPMGYERKRSRALMEQAAAEQKAKEDWAKVGSEISKKYGKPENAEPEYVPPTTPPPGLEKLGEIKEEYVPSASQPARPDVVARVMYGDEQREREQKQRTLEAELQAEERATEARGSKNPTILRMEKEHRFFGLGGVPADTRRNLEKHGLLGVSKKRAVWNAAKITATGFAKPTLQMFENVGESALVERTKPVVTETITPSKDGRHYEKTVIKTWTVRTPRSSTDKTSETKYITDAKGKWEVLQKEKITRQTKTPVTSEDRQKFAMSFGSALNGAKVMNELGGLRSITHSGTSGHGLRWLAGTDRPGGIGAGLYGRRGGIGLETINLDAPQATKPQAPKPSSGGKKSKAGVSITAAEMRMAMASAPRSAGAQVSFGQPIRAQPVMIGPQAAPGAPQPMAALQAQSITPFEGYTPEYSTAGRDYRNQVSRWVGGRPKVTGFLSENETPLAWNLVRAQKTMDLYTGLNPWGGPITLDDGTQGWGNITQPTLSQNALKQEAGLTHSAGPSHDIANQIFNPGYGIFRMRGTGRIGNTDVLGMFMGKRLPMSSPRSAPSSRFAPAPRQARRNLVQITEVKLSNGNGRKLQVIRKGGPQ